MKTIIFGLLLIAGSAKATTLSVVCSDASGSVKTVKYQTEVVENQSLNKDELTMKYAAMFGMEEKTFKMGDLKTVLSVKVIDSSKSTIQTFCNVNQTVVNKTYISKGKISKKDGTPFYVDDTPDSSPQSVDVTLICESTLVSDWPCK
jgi:hypothetical protein